MSADDPGDDRPDGAPGDPHQLGDRGLRARASPARRPSRRRPGCARRRAAPTAPRDHHPVLGAAHPRRVGLQHRLHRAQIQRPPAAPPSPGHSPGTAVRTPRSGRRAPCAAAPARPAPARPRRTRPPRRPVFSTPNSAAHSLALRTPFSAHDRSGPSTAQKPRRERRVALSHAHGTHGCVRRARIGRHPPARSARAGRADRPGGNRAWIGVDTARTINPADRAGGTRATVRGPVRFLLHDSH